MATVNVNYANDCDSPSLYVQSAARLAGDALDRLGLDQVMHWTYGGLDQSCSAALLSCGHYGRQGTQTNSSEQQPFPHGVLDLPLVRKVVCKRLLPTQNTTHISAKFRQNVKLKLYSEYASLFSKPVLDNENKNFGSPHPVS